MRKRKQRFGLAVGAALVALCASAGAASAVDTLSFVSNPSLHPPKVTVTAHARHGLAPGLIFVGDFDFASVATGKPPAGQSGPLVLDNNGHPIWYRPIPSNRYALNTAAQMLGGKPVLTWWQGGISPTGVPSFGTDYIVGSDYKPLKGYVKTLTGVNDWTLSMHEFLITRRGTALVTAYKQMGPVDLTPYGGSASGSVLDSAVQEYSLRTGHLLRTWDFMAHVPLSSSETHPGGPAAWDPYHINSIEEDAAGNLLVSARNTWAIYNIDKTWTHINYELGGKTPTFTGPANTMFAFQHDARFHSGNEISLFDNHCCGFLPTGTAAPPVGGGHTRALILRLNTTNHTLSVVHEYTHTNPALTAGSQGDDQLLANGNVFVGWGQQPYFSEFSRTGKLLFDAHFPGTDISYRARRFVWTGHPAGGPSAAVGKHGAGRIVYASWNGSTQVSSWEVLAGRDARHLTVLVRHARRGGFETAVRVSSTGPLFQVRALDARGHVLGRSKLVAVPRHQNKPSPLY